MLHQNRIVVVLPSYNSSATLEKTFAEIPHHLVDEIVFTDDASTDNSVEVAKRLGIRHILIHEKNKGYGANQKTCYDKALALGADIVVMLHPDYQYTPKLIESMCSIIASDVYPVVLGSRILGKGALRGGMPLYKYFFNRLLTFIQNILMNQKLSEYHTGYRAYRSDVLRSINYPDNSDDFVFDNQVMAQVFFAGYEVAEVTCPTVYTQESSSINFRRSIRYGTGVVAVSLAYFLQKTGLVKFKMFRQR